MRVFISYRREDNPYLAEAIYTTLSNGYGDNNVFLDTASIHGGAEFERRIRQRVSMADAVVAVFGRQWQRSVPTSGRNWVVEELNLAREMGRLVVPVWEDLLDTMDYPEELGWLDQRNRVVIHAGRSQEDLAELPGLLTAAYRDHLSSSGLNDDAIQAALERAVRAEVASASPATRPLNREILLGIGLHGPNGYTPWLAGAVGELIDFCRDPQHSAAYRTLCEQAAVDEASIDIVWGDAAGGVIAVLAAAAVAADIGGERVEEQIIRLVDAGHLLGAPAATRDEVLFRAHDFFAPSLSACLESWLSATKRGRGACELVTVGTAQQICADPAGPSPCLAHVSLGPDDDADALAAKLVTAALVSTASRMIFGTMLAKQEDHAGLLDLVTSAPGFDRTYEIWDVFDNGSNWGAGAHVASRITGRRPSERSTDRYFVVVDPLSTTTIRARHGVAGLRDSGVASPDPRVLARSVDDTIAREQHRRRSLAEFDGTTPDEFAQLLVLHAAKPSTEAQRGVQLGDALATSLINYLADGGTACPPLPLIRHQAINLSSVVRQRLRAEVRQAHHLDRDTWMRGPLALWQHAAEADRWIEDLLRCTPSDGHLLGPRARVQAVMRAAAACAELQHLMIAAIAEATDTEWIRSALTRAASIVHHMAPSAEAVYEAVRDMIPNAGAVEQRRFGELLRVATRDTLDPPGAHEDGFALIPQLWKVLWDELAVVAGWATDPDSRRDLTAWPARATEHRALDAAGGSIAQVMDGLIALLGSATTSPNSSRTLSGVALVAPQRASARVPTDDDDVDLGGLMGPTSRGLGALMRRRWRAHDALIGRLDASRAIIDVLCQRIAIDHVDEAAARLFVADHVAARRRELLAAYLQRVRHVAAGPDGAQVDQRTLFAARPLDDDQVQAILDDYTITTEGLRSLPRGRRQAIALKLAASATRLVLAHKSEESLAEHRNLRAGPLWKTRAMQTLVLPMAFIAAAPSLTLLAVTIVLVGWLLGGSHGWPDQLMPFSMEAGSRWYDGLRYPMSRVIGWGLLLVIFSCTAAVGFVRVIHGNVREWLSRMWPVLGGSAIGLVVGAAGVRASNYVLAALAALVALIFTTWVSGWRRIIPIVLAGGVQYAALTVEYVGHRIMFDPDSSGTQSWATPSGALIVGQILAILGLSFLAASYDVFAKGRLRLGRRATRRWGYGAALADQPD